MSSTVRPVIGVVLFLLLAIPTQGFAQSASSAASKSLANNLNSAKTQVTQAQQSLFMAAGHLKESESKYGYQRRHVSTVRAKVFEEHDKSGSLVDARKEVEKLDKEFAALIKPILDRVRAQSDYRAMARKLDSAEQQIKEGVESDNQRDILLKEILSLKSEMRNLEKTACLENTEAKAAYTNRESGRERVKSLCQDRDQEISRDANLTEAYSELQSSKQQLEQAQVQVASERAKLAAAEQHLAQAMAAQAAASRRTTTRRRN